MTKSSLLRTLLLVAVMALAGRTTCPAANDGGTFTAGKKTFLLNGKPFVVKAAELHYPRIPRPYWEHRIRMCRALDMNTICLYVFWNIHEQREGEFDFTGQNDIAAFCRLAQKNGMYVIVRPGPYVCAEWRWADCPGGCSKRRMYVCASRTLTSWTAYPSSWRRWVNSSLRSPFRTEDR